MFATNNKKRVHFVLLFIFIVLPFIVGIVLSVVYVNVTVSDKHFKEMEKTVSSVYEQKCNNVILYEIPDNFECSITDTSIKISHKNLNGFVEGRLKDGKLTITRDEEFGNTLMLHILTGVLFEVLGLVILIVIDAFTDCW